MDHIKNENPAEVEKITSDEQKRELFRILASLDGEASFERLFDDLCTYNEIEQMAQRLVAAELLIGGATYNQVMAKTGISSATLSRVSRCLQRGSGGYSEILRGALKDED